MPKLAILVSGAGSLLDAILAHPLQVDLVIADRECPAVNIARWGLLPVVVLPRTFGAGFDRDRYTDEVLAALQAHDIDLVAMAGFMTVLSPSVFAHFPDRILNTHPSLLPAFAGAHAVERTLAAGADITGCTVHIATSEMDKGPILARSSVPVHTGDTVASLHERIKQAERQLYPNIIARVLAALTEPPLP